MSIIKTTNHWDKESIEAINSKTQQVGLSRTELQVIFLLLLQRSQSTSIVNNELLEKTASRLTVRISKEVLDWDENTIRKLTS